MRKIIILLYFCIIIIYFLFKKIYNSVLLFIFLKKKKFKNNIFIALETSEIGSLSGSAKYIIELANKQNLDFSRIILLSKKKVINDSLIYLLKNNIKIYRNNYYYNILKNSFSFFSSRVIRYRIRNGFVFKNGIKVSLNFNHNQHLVIDRIAKTLNFDLTKEFVSVSNRDNYFYNSIGTPKDFNTYRNSGFENLRPAINYLQKNNYFIVRAGHYDVAEIQDNKIINIMNLEKKEKAWFDLFIHSNCKFSIVPSSGIAWLPCLFNVPVLMHNAIPLGQLPSINRGIIIPKLIRNVKDEQITSVKKLLKTKRWKIIEPSMNNLNFFYHISSDNFQANELYNKSCIKSEENSSEEISHGVKELIKFVINKEELSKYEKNNQEKFRKLFPETHPIFLSKAIISPFWLDKYITSLSQ
jgi:putative glycosyltransferase (TIGR04372 family)